MSASASNNDMLVDRFDIGGRSLFLDSQGTGTPTVIIERGMGCASTNDPSWLPFRAALAPTVRFCLYDRANLGQSDPAPGPRTAADVVADLHTLLQVARIPPPYIVVGHSLGGLFARLYADQYRHDIAGILLDDAMHPDGLDAELAVLGSAHSADPFGVQDRRALLQAVATDSADLPEPIMHMPSLAQVRRTRHLGTTPLVILTGAHHAWPSDFPPDLVNRLQAAWQRINDQLSTLSTQSRRIIAERSGHQPHIDEPQTVVDAIKWIIERVSTA
jgi:pimeloyl-ACP methyl ester carboxylesterase